MKINQASRTIYVKNRGQVTPIAELELDDETIIYVLPGSRGQRPNCDILIKYKKKDKHIRTPKHVHWAVDLLIKKQKSGVCNKKHEKLLEIFSFSLYN